MNNVINYIKYDGIFSDIQKASYKIDYNDKTVLITYIYISNSSNTEVVYYIEKRDIYMIDNYGYCDNKTHLKNKLKFNFNPSLETPSGVPENSGLIITRLPGYYWNRIFYDRSTNINFNEYLYLSGSTETKDLLSNMDYKHNVYCDTELTLRSFNTIINQEYRIDDVYTSWDEDTRLDKQHIIFYKKDVKILECYIDIPYVVLDHIGSGNFTPNTHTEYPFGLPNLNGNDITITGYYHDNQWISTTQDSILYFNGCDLSFDLILTQTLCDCTCIDKTTGELVDCDDPNGGCSNSPYAETECWNTVTNRKCDFKEDNPENFICRDIITHEPCVTNNIEDTSCVWDKSGVFLGNISGEVCHSPNIDWIHCISHVIQEPITKTINNVDNLQTYFSRSDVTLTNTYELNILECNSRFDGINVAWENNLGGIDYHLFTLADEKSITSKKQTYDFSKNEIINNLMVKKEFYKETMVLSNITTVEILATTNWLNQNDINGMEDLFESTEVYIKYDGEWRYVINSAKKAIIYNKKRKGLKKYQVTFILSEKIRR